MWYVERKEPAQLGKPKTFMAAVFLSPCHGLLFLSVMAVAIHSFLSLIPLASWSMLMYAYEAEQS